MKLSRMGVSPLLLLVALLLGACSSFKLNPTSLDVTSINLPQVQGDLTFGDIVYNPRLKKVLVPSGADQLFLIDPESRQVSVFSGLGSSSQPGEIVSVASGSELLFLLDQGMPQIIVVEPGSGTVVASVSVVSVS
ncbi:MAG: hypothetical protein EHM70_19800 [Chloroflexota bacterium]|nr:MAG: hypothetical protein EHM70_19800 [Chloroflexota bacterium]